MRAVRLTVKSLPGRPVILGALCLLLALPSLASSQGVFQVKEQGQAPAPRAVQAIPAGPLLSARQIMELKQVVYHERRSVVLLERAKQHLRDDELNQAFDTLQILLGDPQELLSPPEAWSWAPSDSFFLEDSRLKSVRREALLVFESMTRDQLGIYEKKYASTASSALQSARQSGRSSAFLEVARRCFATPAGAHAMDEAATQLLDRGEVALAARLWLRLVQSNVHRHRLQPRHFEKAATALFLTGSDQEARQVIADAERIFDRLPFSSASIESVVANHPGFTTMTLASSEGEPFGNPSNNASSQGSVPYLSPVWTKPLYGDRPLEKLANWERDRTTNELAETGVAVFPIVAQNQLIVRDLHGIRSCDPKTGDLLWRYNSSLSVSGIISRLRQADPGSSASLIEMAWAENSAQGIVTSDGQRVFAIDWLNFEAQNIPGERASVKASNRLICLTIPDPPDDRASADNPVVPRVQPTWSIGDHSENGVLGDQLFLGAPRPVGDALFVLSESRRDRELNLIKLEAATGRVIWIQKIGLVEQPSFTATQRARNLPMALPAEADGTVICQPDAEIIVAVDAVQGELKWIYAYGRDGIISGRSRMRFAVSGGGFRGFPSTPLIHQQSVFCLPQHSDDIHRLDLKTGQPVWKVKREEDAYLAAVTDRIVASVGKHGVRGLAFRDGSVVWNARTGLPSGRGVRLNDRYIVPLKAGGIASVDLETGRWTKSAVVPELARLRYERSRQAVDGILVGARSHHLALFGLDDDRVSNEVRPGNLLFHDGLVFSVGPQHLTAFKEADELLDELREPAAQNPSADELLIAQLEVSTDQQDQAAARLARTIAKLESRPSPTEEESSTLDRAKWLLRELIVRRLNEDWTTLPASRRLDFIEQLTELSEQPQEQSYALIEQAVWQAENVSPVSAVRFARQAIDAGLDSFVPMKESPDCFMTAAAYARSLVRKSLQSASFSARAGLQDLVEQDLQVAVSLDTIDSLKRFLNLYAAVPEAGRARNRLADLLIQSGQVQEAELLLFQNRSHESFAVRAVAEALLISLWSELKLSFEAGEALYRFSQDFSGADLSAVSEDRLMTVLSVLNTSEATGKKRRQSGADRVLTGTDFVRLFSGDQAARKVFTDLHPLGWKVQNVTVRQTPVGLVNPLASGLWNGSSRRIIHGQRSEFDLVRDSNGLQSKWRILDRLAGIERGSINMPGRLTIPGPHGYRSVGHLMPVGTAAGMQAVSLLEHQDERPFWKLHFPPLESDQNLIEPGPATASVCVFQTRKHLFGIDPSNGRVLWRRSDLDLASGVHVDREAGLFGDDQILVMFHADQASFTVFSTQTGEVVREGRLDVDFRYPHRVIGRRLFHVTQEKGTSGKRIRIWDPLTDAMLLDEELIDRFYSAWSTDDELALMTTDTRLRVFSADASRVIVDLKLDRAETSYVSSLRVFSDDENIYINLQRSEVTGNPNKLYSLASDSVVPVEHVHRGLLIGASRETGELLWKTPVQQRSFIRADRCSLPFLVGLSRVSPKRTSSTRSLEVRVIDRRTGEDYVEPASMIQDKIVRYQIDRDAGELQLHGLNSRIDLQFRRFRERIPLQEQPL